MSVNHVFLGFMTFVGIAAGLSLVAYPESRDFQIIPYFWIVIAMAIFEVATYARGRGTAATMISMEVRLIGFLIGVALMIVIPILAGSPGRLI